MISINKSFLIGWEKGPYGEDIPITITVRFNNGNLSITGETKDSGGQIYDSVKPEKWNDGWDRRKWEQLKGIWKQWHLNNMRAGCEHQTRLKWGKEKVTITTYRLNNETIKARADLRKKAETVLQSGKSFEYLPEEIFLFSLPYFTKAVTAENEKYYQVEKEEEKYSSQVYPQENPKGVLTKPCPVCGYKYGTAWKREEVPAEVVEFLQSL